MPWPLKPNNWKQPAILVMILLWLAWHLSLPIDLIRSDLGRHLKDGELIWQGHHEVLYQNYYSYTFPQYPFVNYQWLFGVCSYGVWHYLGFTGLAVIALLIAGVTFYLFFRLGRRYVSFKLACGLSLLFFPLICFRTEIRPELISYLFLGIFWWLLDAYQQERLRFITLILVLLGIEILWVNMHVFFVLGPLLTLLFCFQAFSNGDKEKVKQLQVTFFLLLSACLINPFGVAIFALPFETWIHKSSYQITESIPLWQALQSNLLADYRLFLIYVSVMMLAVMLILIWLIKRDGVKKYILVGTLMLILSLATLKAVRMLELFGYVALPVSMYLLSQLFPAIKKKVEICLIILGVLVSAVVNVEWTEPRMLGLIPGDAYAADFIKQAKIKGPIFNNYSIGSYLIFSLSPQYKVWVDNRGVAAYPESFFTKIITPLQSNEALWQQLDHKFNFNVIFYSPDKPDWEGGFIWRRLNDPAWALVFHDDKTVIFLKCNAQNQRLFAQPLCH